MDIPWNNRVHRNPEIILDDVKVSMAYSAVQNLQCDIVIPGSPTKHYEKESKLITKGIKINNILKH